jgi:hypothetical protein
VAALAAGGRAFRSGGAGWTPASPNFSLEEQLMKFSEFIHGPTHQPDSGYADADHATPPPAAPPIHQEGGVLSGSHAPVATVTDGASFAVTASGASAHAAVEAHLQRLAEEQTRLLADARRKA